ncbi:hypothetical protein Tco_0962299 [Tanacetum coccineum]
MSVPEGLDKRIWEFSIKVDVALPLRDQRHQYLRYEGLQYTDENIVDFETRLARIYRREVHRVQVFDFGGLPDLIAEGLSTRMLMEHRGDQGQSVFTSRAWRRLFNIRGPLVHELILEFFSTFRFREAVLDLDTDGALQFQLGGRETDPRQGGSKCLLDQDLICGGFSGYTQSYTLIRDPMLRLCHRLIACSIAGRSQEPKKAPGVDGDCASYIPVIDMAELVRLQICIELDDTWAWVPAGLARLEGDARGVIKKALVAPGGGLERGPVCALHEIFRVIGKAPEMHQAEDGRCQHLRSPAAARPMIPLSFIFCFYPLIKTGSKFNTIVHEYFTEPSTLSKSRAELRRESDFKCVKAKRRKDLAERKEIDEVGEVSIIWNPMCDCSWNGYLRKGRKTKPKPDSEWKSKEKTKSKSKPKPEKSTQVNPEAKSPKI